MIRVKAKQSFGGTISMYLGEERIVEPTKEMKELIECGYVEVIEDLSEDYKGVELKDMTKKQLVKFAKDNKIPIAEAEPIKVILEQVEAYLKKKEPTAPGEEPAKGGSDKK